MVSLLLRRPDGTRMQIRTFLSTNFVTGFLEMLKSPLNMVLAALIGSYCLFVWLLGRELEMPTRISFFSYESLLFISSLLFLGGAISGRILYIMLFIRPRRLFHAIGADFKSLLCWRRIWNALPMIIMFPIFFSAFTSFKTLIPDLMPFSHDVLFAKIDRTLHFGVDPWRLLQPFVGYFQITFVIAVIYKFWFLVKFMGLYWQAFSTSRPALRAQFFLAYILSWLINGSLFAVLLSSAGPCFYGLVTGEADLYAPLFEYLRQANEVHALGSLDSQGYLWDVHIGKNTEFLSGISAMPSMHVSVAFLLLLTGWHYGAFARVFFSLFFVATFIGSIHLGWHYAVDGYFAILSNLLLWILSGWLVRQRFPALSGRQEIISPVSA